MLPISVCIIAKNEENRIEKCLSSLRSYGFEIVVVDTGSTDRTKEIAGKYADKVLDFEWCDDFSAARNYSLRAASNNWIFMIDCDEYIKTIDIEELNWFRKHLADSVGSVTRENIVTKNDIPAIDNIDNTERFFDKRLYRYTGMIHEQLTPIRSKDFTAYLLKTTILHTGYDMSDEECIAKYERNFTLLEKQLVTDPDNPYLYYQLGKTCEIVGDFSRACEYYSKGLSYDLDPELAYVQAMVVSYGNALLLTGQQETALGFESIYDAFSPSADFVYLMGNIYRLNQMYEQALEQYQKAIGIPLCKQNGANSFLPIFRTGEICELMGDITTAIACYNQCGSFAPAKERLRALSRQ
ncbi:MAG: glycosyltransferase [Clostridiales bacterium]|nr:glycosyltransferase [Clostridiales bacterium]